MTLYLALRFLHILSASVWLGAALWVAGDVKRALALGRPHSDAIAARVRPSLGLDAAAGIATLVTGFLLMWAQGMGHPRLGITAGIVLTLLRIGVLVAMRGSWRRILGRLQAGEPVSAADPAARKMSMFAGIAHTLWLLALAGMVFPI